MGGYRLREIRFDVNKRGTKVAYQYYYGVLRGYRMPLAEAELIVAQEGVPVCSYGPNPAQYGIKTERISETENMVTIRYYLAKED